MYRKFLILSICFASFALCPLECHARWGIEILEDFVKGFPVIVTGSVDSIIVADAVEAGGPYSDVAVIAVDSVLKNTLPNCKLESGDKIPLYMWSEREGLMFPPPIRYKVGEEGVWILHRIGDRFRTYHPDELQLYSKLEEISGYIREQEREAVGDSLK